RLIRNAAVGRIDDPRRTRVDVAVPVVRLDVLDAAALAAPVTLQVGRAISRPRRLERLRLLERTRVKCGRIARAVAGLRRGGSSALGDSERCAQREESEQVNGETPISG